MLGVRTAMYTQSLNSGGRAAQRLNQHFIQLKVYCTLKWNAGFGKELQITYPIPSPQDCSRMPVIRIGHGSTVPPMVIMFAVGRGCTTSKWWGAVSFQQYNPRLGPFGFLYIIRFINQARGCFYFRGLTKPGEPPAAPM